MTIASLSVPTIASAGQTITVTETTKNQGGGAADPSTTEFYFSANNTLDASDMLIGSRSVPALAGGESNSGSTSVVIPEGTSSGVWYIIAKADGEEVVTETLETNNTSVRSIGIGADLVVASMSVPATASAGQAITINETTENQGGGAADASRTQFFLSANTALDASDTMIGSRSVPSLAAGASSSGSTSVVVPAGTASGSWFVIAKADGEEVVTETSETNNTYLKSIVIGADLAVTALSAPTTASAGQTITVTDTTKNNGGGVADPSRTQFFLSDNTALDTSDTLIGSRSVPSLAAGASSSGSTSVVIPVGTAAGSWYLIAKADGEEVVVETSETNNTYIRSIKIGSDLVVTALSAPTTGGAGQTIVISDTTKNQGGGVAGPSLTQFYLSTNSTLDASDTLIGSRGVPSLAAGVSSSGSTSVVIPVGVAPGYWYIIAKADGEEVVIETSETNNLYARSFRIGPDLAVTSLSAPTTASAGQTIVITDTTKNQGGGAADASLTQFYLSANSTLDASDTLLGSRSVPTLAAGASSFGSTSVIIPEGTASGYWYLIAKADGAGVVAEITETNNASSRRLTIY